MKQVYGTLVLLLIGFVVGALAVVANAIPTPQVVRVWRGWKGAIVYRKWLSQPMDHQPPHQKVVQ